LKIIILGAGQVGTSVAESLVSEANDITVVDVDGGRLRLLQDRLDLRTVTGSAAHPPVLKDAGIEDADMLIAVTQSDETNLVACKVAAHLYNVPNRIARIRAPQYLANEQLFTPECFAVDYAICPEQLITEYLVKLVQFPEALQVLEFAWWPCARFRAEPWWATSCRISARTYLAWMCASPRFSAAIARSCRRARRWSRPATKCSASPPARISAG
jgi:TrkA-N domain